MMVAQVEGDSSASANWRQRGESLLKTMDPNDAKRTFVVFEFQPFRSRLGVDNVIGLRFEYSASMVADLKAALAVAKRQDGGQRNAGGWLAEHRAWFVEPSAWPVVRELLTANGYRLVQQEHVEQEEVRAQLNGTAGVAVKQAAMVAVKNMKSKAAAPPAAPAVQQPAAGVWGRMPVGELRKKASTGVAGAIGELASRGLAGA